MLALQKIFLQTKLNHVISVFNSICLVNTCNTAVRVHLLNPFEAFRIKCSPNGCNGCRIDLVEIIDLPKIRVQVI